mgnify:CR=1 FL=1
MKGLILILVSSLLSAAWGFSSEVDKEKGNLVSDESVVPTYLYKIVSVEDWEKSQGKEYLVTGSIDSSFIHLATEEQVVPVAKKFWEGKSYVVLRVDPKKMIGRLVYETNPGGTTHYYHLYEGKIPIEAVVDFREMAPKL